MIGRVFNVRVGFAAKRHFSVVGKVDRVAGETSGCVFVPHEKRLIACDEERCLGRDAVVEGQRTAGHHLVDIIIITNAHFNSSACAVIKGDDLISRGVEDGERG